MNKLLIVDDSPSDRELLKEMLGGSNSSEYDIREADSGHSALEVMDDFSPDIVLLDLQMTDMNGFETLREMKTRNKLFIPVLLISAFTGENDRLRGLKLGATDFITKPFIVEEVRARVTVQIELKKAIDNANWATQKTNRGITLLYRELEKKNEELKRLDQLKSDFVSTVSHELRTPLAITMEGLSLVIDGIVGPVSEKQKEILTTSYENIERLSRIINDLLDISKIEAGKVEIHCGFVDFGKTLRKTVDAHQTVVKKRDITLTLDAPPENILLYIDEDKIIQVMNNLINNAYKFTDEGGKINVGLQVRESDVLCSVKDSGVGIAPEDMKKLFSKFQQLNRKEGPGIHGTGLGLVISRALIKLHGGEIWVESELGAGTTFFFTLPTYNVQKEHFDKDFETMIKDARVNGTSVGLIIMQLSHPGELKETLGENGLAQAMNERLADVRKVVSSPGSLIFLFNRLSIYIVLPDTSKTAAAVVQSRLKAMMEKEIMIEGKSVHTVFRIGAALFPYDARDRHELVGTASRYLSAAREVLIVDDEPEVVKMLEMRLKDRGYRTLCACNGKEALKLVHERRQKPDLIVLDVIMPEMNGYELFGRLKENSDTAHIPVIMLTAHEVNMGKLDSPPGIVTVVQKTNGFENLINLMGTL